jgi:hypothetical protein
MSSTVTVVASCFATNAWICGVQMNTSANNVPFHGNVTNFTARPAIAGDAKKKATGYA